MKITIDPDLSIADRISALVDAEIEVMALCHDRKQRQIARDFEHARRKPQEIRVRFSGGVLRRCWSVTREGGTCRVVYMPELGHFALCAESDQGLRDIGIRGPALACFAAA